ncbi:hypothetical protein CSW25_06625 [Thermus scotoductus]|uniref:Uncharacterized protein n=1 Tax=Thermus scotoductus TaxID=37636 RepID=A0ABY0AI35_THESC|nr:DUF5647 family protein [Thermus scotoductus]RTI07249.1 hypothetical protein CSW25_06625 [Thermus scotoductus]
MVNPQGLTAEERLFALQERFGEALLENPGLVEILPENFVLAVLPLDDPEAARLAMESLPRLQGWSREEGPLVHALFQGGEFLAVVLPQGRVIPARAA